MGAAAEAHLPVFPDRRLGLHGIVQGVGLQASLERRAVRAPAGGPGGHPGGEWGTLLHPGWLGWGRRSGGMLARTMNSENNL